MAKTVLITGGTGLIGSALTEALVEKGFKVIVLTRRAKPSTASVSYALWNIEKSTLDRDAIEAADFIVHLAGANVAAGRWTTERKRAIIDSRVKSAELLVKALSETPNKVQALISASAIGYYGADLQVPSLHPFVETDLPDRGFLGRTSQKWEEAVAPVSALDKRLVNFRIGIVLSEKGGAYREFVKPLNFGIASVLGTGKQVVSWIHIDDLVRLFIYAIENSQIKGVYNAVAPEPVSNKKLINNIAKARGGFHITLPVPSFVLKTLLGEMSIEVLKSATVSSKKIQEAGYQFLFPTVEKATADLAERSKKH